MSTPPADGYPGSDPLIDQAEILRQTCPDHGGYYAALYEASMELERLATAGASPSEISANENPLVRQVGHSEALATELFDYSKPPFLDPQLRGLLSNAKTGKINPYADKTSDEYIAKLGRKPDSLDIFNAAISFTMRVALARRAVKRDVVSTFDNSVINQFINALLAKADKEALCEKFPLPHYEDVLGVVSGMADGLAGKYLAATKYTIEPKFVVSELLSQWANTASVIRLHEIKDTMPSVQMETEEAQELGRNNTELAKKIQLLRRYGIKPLDFGFSDIIPGHDAVFHELSAFGRNVQGEQPMALIRLVPEGADATAKVTLEATQASAIEGGLELITLGLNEPLISMDSNGDLFVGSGVSTNAIPLRTLFEHDGALGKYEVMRGALLARLFDAVAPARVVELIGPPPPPGVPGERPAQDDTGNPADMVRRLVLPRVQYFRDTKMAEIRRQFEEAHKAERAELEARSVAWHTVASQCRKLPTGARASAQAVANAKVKFGDNFELPEGYTFVSEYARGDPARGRVIGYTAVHEAGETDGNQPRT